MGFLKKYNPRGKDALFKSISAQYSLKHGPDDSIIDYMSRAHRLFSGIHGITFNTMANLFLIVKYDHSCFGALTNCFQAGDPEVVNADVNRIETLLDAIESFSRIVNYLPTIKPSALCGSAPRLESTPVPAPKTDRPKTTALPGGTCSI